MAFCQKIFVNLALFSFSLLQFFYAKLIKNYIVHISAPLPLKHTENYVLQKMYINTYSMFICIFDIVYI